MQRHRSNWNTRFSTYVSDLGVGHFAGALGVSPWTVYSWVAGRAEPRLSTARRIVELSRGALSLDDVSRHRQEVGDGTNSGQPGPPRARDFPPGSPRS